MGCGSSAFPSILRDRIPITREGIEDRVRVVSVVRVHEDPLKTDTAILALVEPGVEKLTARLGNGADGGMSDTHSYGATVRKAVTKARDPYFKFVDHKHL